ncbi:unnamed protein product [Mytilus edulis]|uniref:Uncharacterized protein n=1 Tax=Mytilus edulis TaxID=6550 RepID=A0A8S3R090_MYTED|nr:unnamed protein product [Mytilus edulis]
MFETIKQTNELEQKTRKLLHTLNYRGKQGVAALHQAFINTDNKGTCRKTCTFTSKKSRKEKTNRTKIRKSSLEKCNVLQHHMVNRFRMYLVQIITAWPPNVKEENIMLADPLIKITDPKKSLVYSRIWKRIRVQDTGKCRGKVFIINNVDFGNTKENREASNKDATNLSKLFKDLHFDVTRKDNLTGHKINATELKLNVQDDTGTVTQQISQVTMGATGGCDETDSEPFQQQTTGDSSLKSTFLDHPLADFLVAYATPEGSKAWRHQHCWFWFMNAIVWTFKYHAHEEELHHLLIRVNRLVAKGVTWSNNMTVAEVRSNLRKKFYFFPGIHGDLPETF